MNQRSFWSGIILIVTSALLIGYRIDKVAPSQDAYLIGTVVLLLLYGYVICNLYSRLLAPKISFESYRTGLTITIAILISISFLSEESEFISLLRQILFWIMFYSNGILILFDKGFQLSSKDN